MKLEEIENRFNKFADKSSDIRWLIDTVHHLEGAIEKHIIEFDKLMKEMPPNRERGMKLAESVGDLQKALKEEE